MSNIKNVMESDMPMNRLILKFAVPGILSGVVSAMYNIVDQIFIGQVEGMLGNAATNVVFPLVSLSLAMSLLFGIGGASRFSIAQGQKDTEGAKKFVGATLVAIVIMSLLLTTVTLLFLEPMLWAFGATEQNFQLAWDYGRITSFGIPFFMFSSAAPQLIRADGAPKKAMIYGIVGAVLNIVLDAVLMLGFGLGIKGAAVATLVSMIVSAVLCFQYFFRFQSFPITKEILMPDFSSMGKVAALGLAPATNQFTLMLAQITMNNSLTRYGGDSMYGSDIPLAVVGVASKVNVLYMAVAVGLGLGAQPIIGYHYGAGNYDKVKEAYKINAKYVTILSVFVFLLFQLFPVQILSFFGDGSEAYFQFGTRYFRVFMSLAFLAGFNPITANFLTSIGKAKRGMILPFSKQMLFMMPLIVVLPLIWGIDGILLVGPVTDLLTFLLAVYLVKTEFATLK